MVTRYHSLSFVVIRCHLLYHSLSLVVIRCHLLYHSLSLVVTRCTTHLPFYKRSWYKGTCMDSHKLSEGSTYFDLSVNGAALIKPRLHLFIY